MKKMAQYVIKNKVVPLLGLMMLLSPMVMAQTFKGNFYSSTVLPTYGNKFVNKFFVPEQRSSEKKIYFADVIKEYKEYTKYKYKIPYTYAELAYYYVVMELPNEGIYYGYAMGDFDSKELTVDNIRLLRGVLMDDNGNIKDVVGKTPKEWAKNRIKMPAGQYKYYSPNSSTVFSYTFGKGGGFTYESGAEYTSHAYPEKAPAPVYKDKKGRLRRGMRITGGWDFDIDAKAIQKGTWKINGDKLLLTMNPKLTYVVKDKLNVEKVKERWKAEDVFGRTGSALSDAKIDESRRQSLEDILEDYPNYRVDEEKKRAKENLEDSAVPLDRNNQDSIIAITPNTLIVKISGTNGIMIFYKNTNELSGYPAAIKDCNSNYSPAKYNEKHLEIIASKIRQQMTSDDPFLKKIIYYEIDDSIGLDNSVPVSLVVSEDGVSLKLNGAFTISDNGTDVDKFKKSISEDADFKNLVNDTEESNRILKMITTDKKYKKASKIAQKFFKNHIEFDHYTIADFKNIDEFNEMVSGLTHYHKAQQYALEECQKKLGKINIYAIPK